MRNGDDNNTFEAEQEILAILSRMQATDAKEAVTDTASTEDAEEKEDVFAVPASPDTSATDIPLILPTDNTEEKKAPRTRHTSAPKSKAKREKTEAEKVLVTAPEEEEVAVISPFSRVISGLSGLIPKKGDQTSEIVRKCVFLLSLAVFLCSLGFLLYYMVLEPSEVTKENNYYVSLFNDTEGNKNADTDNTTQSIQPSFRQLYSINKDVAGWLSYNSSDSDTFLKINLPVVWCGNNDTYLSRGFDGNYSRSGTLFFDQSNTFKEGVSNKVSIIYGHNMASGAMFAPLNKLIGNVYRARAASTLKLDTLYESNQYKVFAVIVSDESAEAAYRFGYLRTAFADSNDFMTYVNELRARSLFDYPVDVQPNDELLILSTCTNKSQVKVANGRFAIIARRVRDGETATTDTAKIMKNEDVIMPYAWYTAQGLTPHAFYTQTDYVIPETGSTTTGDANGTTVGTTTDTTGDTTDTSATDTTSTTVTTSDGTTVTTTQNTTTVVTTVGTSTDQTTQTTGDTTTTSSTETP